MPQDLTGKLELIKKRAQRRGDVLPAFLPSCPDNKRATPNTFLRSALFSAIQSKDRIFLKEEILASQAGVIVKFTGEQLNQEDLTVWEALVHLAKEQPIGTICDFSAYEILISLDLPTNGDGYKKLHSTLIRLMACAVEIRHGGTTYSGSLIVHSIKDEKTSHYLIELNKSIINLYGQTEWTRIDWKQRNALKRKPLAMALHGYYSSHKSPYPVKIETLMKLSGSKSKQLANFKIKVNNALHELVAIGFLVEFKIEGGLVSVNRLSTLE